MDHHCTHQCKGAPTSSSSLPFWIGCRRQPALGSLSCSTLFAYGSQTPHSARARRVCSCCERLPCSSLGVISRLYPAHKDSAEAYRPESCNSSLGQSWKGTSLSLFTCTRNHASLRTETSGPIQRLLCFCDRWPGRVPFPRFLGHCIVAHIRHPSACGESQ